MQLMLATTCLDMSTRTTSPMLQAFISSCAYASDKPTSR